MKNAVLSNQPPKGTSDWFPNEFAIRKYIFDTWREVCLSFGYEEYLTPILESADIYRAKSGEDVGGKELMTMTDRAGRELSIRPEMTPSVTRMVTRVFNDRPKPIRYFSIANYFRNEKPQRGRNREFWQLNFDVFGSNSVNADIEILQMGIEILKAFGADENNFVVLLNHRKFIEEFLNRILNISEENYSQSVRILDKFGKLDNDVLIQRLEDEVGAEINDKELFLSYMKGDLSAFEKVKEMIGESDVVNEVNKIQEGLDALGFKDFYRFDPSIIRGFDYYDGMVFEVFDKNPENSRSLFGGGRYNGLASLFGSQSFPAVGCAPGDETTKLFLEGWDLLPDSLFNSDIIFLPLLDAGIETEVNKLADKLRKEENKVEVGFETMKFGKAFEYANKRGFSKMIILGSNEIANNEYKIKDLSSGEELALNLIS